MKHLYHFFILLFTIGHLTVHAQFEDATWFIGMSYYGTPGFSFYQLDQVPDYNKADTIFPPHNRLIRDSRNKASISDLNGNLLFFYDGFDIFNKNFYPMKNGDSIYQKKGVVLEDRYNSPTGLGVNSSLILPQPENGSLFIVVYLNITLIPGNVVWKSYGLTYSVVDLNGDDGMGEVIQKNISLREDQDYMWNSLKAIRHANGRDWWIPIKERINGSWQVFLLDPGGLRFHHHQELEGIEDFYPYSSSYNYALDQMVYLAGDHYFPWQGGTGEGRWYDHQFHVFDFDRCTGLFTFSETHEISTHFRKFYMPDFEISTNGKYIYVFTEDNLKRYQLTAPDDPGISRLDTILQSSKLDYSRGFTHLKFTPFGELWVVNHGSEYLTVISDPELPNLNSNHPTTTMKSVWKNQGFFPNNPNYRIGPIDNSPCDTLGINNEPKAWFRYNDINLEYRQRRFTDISYFRPEQWQWDFDDGTTYDGQHPRVHEFPAPGEYYVCLTVSNEYAEDTYCEWVVIDELSSTEEIAADDGFWVFPNPTTGDFTLRLEKPVTKGTEIRVYDLLGRELHRHPLPAGSSETLLSLGQLPSGKYILQLFDGERVRTGSVFLIDN